MMYNPSNWFWFVADDLTKVYSSSACGFVSVSDATYTDFVRSGSRATQIASMDDLTEVLAAQYPAGTLLTYANAAQWTKAVGGYPATVGGQQIDFPTSVESMALISGKAQRLQMPNPPAAINWQTGSTTFIDIPAADFLTLATAIADFVQGTFDVLKDVVAQILSGQITTRSQIDQSFA